MSGEGFKINKEFAEKFQKRKERDELLRLKVKYGDCAENSSSSSESEDDDGKELTAEFDKEIFSVLAALKSGDPKIYDENVTFYHKRDDDDDDDSDSKSTVEKKEKTIKPMFLKDYERKVITERGGKFTDDVSEESNAEDGDEKKPSAYTQQLEELKKDFQAAAAEIDDDDDEDNEDFIFKKEFTKDEKVKREADYLEWMKGRPVELEKDLAKKLAPLKDLHNNPNANESDKFLMDYFVKQKFKYTESDLNEEELLKEAEEDEKEFKKEEHFAHKVNFRFEEPDQEFIKNYPRTIANSMRAQDTKRADKRKQVKDRKQAEEKKQEEEKRRFKNLMMKELHEKEKKIQKMTGNSVAKLTKDDLEEDFDPDKHDKLMQQLIGDDYYDQDDDDDGDEKPTFDIEDLDDDNEEENWDEWNGVSSKASHPQPEHCSQPQPCHSKDSTPMTENTKSKNKKKSTFAEKILKKKPVFDPSEMTYEEYIDKCYDIHQEDLLGDTVCRFKYRTVVPCDFGLNVEEILAVPDRELNAWVSVKKMSQYRTEEEELMDVRFYNKRARNQQKKITIMPSLRQDSTKSQDENNMTKSQSNNEENGQAATVTKNKKRKKKRKANEANGSECKKVRLDDTSMTVLDNRETTNEASQVENEFESGEASMVKQKSQGKNIILSNTQQQKIKKKLKKEGKELQKLDTAVESGCSETKSSEAHSIESSCPAIIEDNNKKNVEAKAGNSGEGEKKKRKRKKHGIVVPTMSKDRLDAYAISEKKFKYVYQDRMHKQLKNKTNV